MWIVLRIKKKNIFVSASHSTCLINLKDRILEIRMWKHFLHSEKLGCELKGRKRFMWQMKHLEFQLKRFRALCNGYKPSWGARQQ